MRESSRRPPCGLYDAERSISRWNAYGANAAYDGRVDEKGEKQVEDEEMGDRQGSVGEGVEME